MYRVTATTEDESQYVSALGCLREGLIYMDSAFFEPESFGRLACMAHERGLKCGLRLPYIWRESTGEYFESNLPYITEAGFDVLLFRNMEGLLWFRGKGFPGSICGMEGKEGGSPYYALDHSIYLWNKNAGAMLLYMLKEAGTGNPLYATYPLELSLDELFDISKTGMRDDKTNASAGGGGAFKLRYELTVYGRAPMMVSAQCVKKNIRGCDKKPDQLTLKDRTGSLMPVKNCCRFCFNTIYNSVPTAIYDMESAINRLSPFSVRYEFTVEGSDEVKRILSGEMPPQGAYTRGRYKKGAQ